MFFRNLTFFRFPRALPVFPTRTDKQLAECRLKPVGSLELASRGFVSPTGMEPQDDHSDLTFWGQDAVWFSVGSEERMLPGAVLQTELDKKLREIEEKEGRRPGGRARKRLKEELVHELLPKAFVRPSRIDAYLDLQLGVLVVDTASRKAAENVAGELRRALGSFPALPLNAEVAPRGVLTGWVAGEPLPEGLVLGHEVTLKDASDAATVRITGQELQGDEVVKHLEAGKQVTRLELYSGDHVSFNLGEDLTLRKLKLLDGAVDSLANVERDDLHAELEARFALLVGEVREVFATLESALKLSQLEE